MNTLKVQIVGSTTSESTSEPEVYNSFADYSGPIGEEVDATVAVAKLAATEEAADDVPVTDVGEAPVPPWRLPPWRMPPWCVPPFVHR